MLLKQIYQWSMHSDRESWRKKIANCRILILESKIIIVEHFPARLTTIAIDLLLIQF